MNIQQTNQLLARIQVIDNRQIGDSTVLAWHELVGDLDYAASVEAVRLHFRESTSYLLPAHVVQGVARILHADPNPEDEHGNRLARDEAALAARQRLAAHREVTA